jgi:hypothetical protein
VDNPSKYQLFIRTKCSCCDDIVSNLKVEEIEIQIINIDYENYNLPFKLAIFPALVIKNKIVGYGCDDILACLKSV